MADYISRKAAIEAFENADADVLEDYGDGACDWGFGMKNIQNVLNSVPAADVEPVRHGRWIPCSERLPEAGKRVLATDGGFVGEMYINQRRQWQRYDVVNHESLMALDILWWMPMPEPPEED